MPTENRRQRLNTHLYTFLQQTASGLSGSIARVLFLLGFATSTLLLANTGPISKSQHALPWGTCGVELTTVDENHDGYYDSLGIILEFDAKNFVSFQALLALSDQSIPAHTDYGIRNAPPDLHDLPRTPGQHTIRLKINGPQIRASGHEGPCSVEITFRDAKSIEAFREGNRSGSSISIPIRHLSSQDFEGPFLKIEQIDSSVSCLPDSHTIETLTLVSILQSERKATGEVFLELHVGDRLVFDTSREITLKTGKQPCAFTIPGPILFAQRTDGPYTAVFTVTDPYGNTTTATHQTQPISAHQFLKPAAHFSGEIRAYGQDTDGDDKFDHLIIEPNVQTRKPGKYRVKGRVDGPSGEFVGNLEPLEIKCKPDVTPKIRFSLLGLGIFRKKVNGPFTVHLEMYDRDKPIDGIVLQTGSFLYSDFQTPGIQLTGDSTCATIDTNQDGHSDTLRISTGVKVSKPGTYSVAFTIVDPEDPSNRQLNRRQDVRLPEQGIQSIQIDFPRSELLALEGNGPYQLLSMSIELDGISMDSTETANHLLSIPYSIANLYPTELEVMGSISDRGNDLNGDGQNDELVIEMDVFAPKDGVYACNAMLYDLHTKPVAQYVAAQGLPLIQGLNRIALTFSGLQIRESKRNGPYSLHSLSLYPINNPDSYLKWRTEPYTTRDYRWDRFGLPDAKTPNPN